MSKWPNTAHRQHRSMICAARDDKNERADEKAANAMQMSKLALPKDSTSTVMYVATPTAPHSPEEGDSKLMELEIRKIIIVVDIFRISHRQGRG